MRQHATVLVLMIALSASAPALRAQTVTWDGGGDGTSWSDAANWNPNGVPTASSDVVIDMSASITLNTSVSARSLAINAPGVTITLSDGALLTLAESGGPGDTPPLVQIAGPADGSTVTGIVTLEVSASDAEDAAGSLLVEVSIGGGAYQEATYNSTKGYYEYVWVTSTAPDGSTTLEARATDSGSNTVAATPASVTVDNGGSTPQTVTWDGGGDGTSWSDAANWNPNGVPTASSDVVIDMSASITLSTSVSARSLAINAPGVTITLSDGALLTFQP